MDIPFDSLANQAFLFTQVLLGVISPNFRMVYLSKINEQIHITIILEKPNAEDFEEIEELGTEFEARQISDIDYVITTVVEKNSLAWPDISAIVVFRRRET